MKRPVPDIAATSFAVVVPVSFGARIAANCCATGLVCCGSAVIATASSVTASSTPLRSSMVPRFACRMNERAFSLVAACA